MRTFARGLSLIIVAGLVGGCSGTGAKPAATTQPGALVGAGVMQSGGVSVLRLAVPPDAKCAAADGTLHVTSTQYEVEFWVVPGASSVGDGVTRASGQIVDEFKDFKPDHTTDLTVAGSAAKGLVGKGHEADDGDEGSAYLVVFKAGGHVFVACTHGETLKPEGQAALLTLVQTAQVP